MTWAYLCAGVAQLAEQLTCNQQVIGSSPIVGFMEEFPSGQRGQTVNLLALPSVVRIHLPPFSVTFGYQYRGVEQLVARRAHNPKVVGSSPSSATQDFH